GYHVPISLRTGIVFRCAVDAGGQNGHGDLDRLRWSDGRATRGVGLSSIPTILPRRAVEIAESNVLDFLGNDKGGFVRNIGGRGKERIVAGRLLDFLPRQTQGRVAAPSQPVSDPVQIARHELIRRSRTEVRRDPAYPEN